MSTERSTPVSVLDIKPLQLLLQLALMATLGHGVCSSFLIWLAWTETHETALLWGPAAIALTALLYQTDTHHLLKAPPQTQAHPATRHRLVVHILMGTSSYVYTACTLMPRLDPQYQVLMGLIVCGAVPVGGMVLAAVPLLSLTWIWMLTVGIGYALLSLNSPVWNAASGLLLLMGLLATASALAFGRMLRARLNAEAQALEDRHSLNIVLSDFETQASDWVWEADAQGHLTRVALRMAQALGHPGPEPLLGRPLAAALSAPQAKALTPDLLVLQQQIALQLPFNGLDIRPPLSALPGLPPPCWSINALPIRNSEGHCIGWRGLVRDVTQTRAQAQELQRLAHIDTLTQLANRHAFVQHCQERIQARLQERRTTAAPASPIPLVPLSLFLIDLDNFKTVNDAFGHSTGDQLLREVSQRLLACQQAHPARQHIALARLGGDEFALLLDTPHTVAEREALALAMSAAVHTPWVTEDLRVEVCTSIGVAPWHPGINSADQLLQNADIALYEAKAAGRHAIRVFDGDMGQRMSHRLTLTRELSTLLAQQSLQRHAVTTWQPTSAKRPADIHPELGRLMVYYQPQYTLDDGRLVGVEALLRWQHPVRGWVSPADFIPLAEQAGLIVPLGQWVLEQACQDAMDWPMPLQLAVNLSAQQLSYQTLVPTLQNVLAQTHLPVDRLELEITETSLLTDPALAQSRLQEIRHMGIKLALDDFGTGYSSLTYLATLPVTTLKIDRSFVWRLGQDHQAQTILDMIIRLGHSLGMTTLAEGVETPAQRDELQRFGCHQVQGFLYAKPMSQTDLCHHMQALLATSGAAATATSGRCTAP